MRLLLDSCVWGGAARDLISAGHDVESVANWAEDPGDEEILLAANKQKQILVTLDKDFGELAVVRGVEHCGIVRLSGFSARKQGEICVHIIEKYSDELKESAIVTAHPGRVRIRPRVCD